GALPGAPRGACARRARGRHRAPRHSRLLALGAHGGAPAEHRRRAGDGHAHGGACAPPRARHDGDVRRLPAPRGALRHPANARGGHPLPAGHPGAPGLPVQFLGRRRQHARHLGVPYHEPDDDLLAGCGERPALRRGAQRVARSRLAVPREPADVPALPGRPDLRGGVLHLHVGGAARELALPQAARRPRPGSGPRRLHRLDADAGAGPVRHAPDDGRRGRRRLDAPRPGHGRRRPRRRRADLMRFRTRALMLTWAPYSGRSEGLAQHLGIRNYFVHYLAFQRPWVAPVKYPLQAATTLRILQRERPAVVLVQNPPPVAPLLAALYSAAIGAGFIVDSHSQVLLVRRWRWTLPLQRWLARRALTTIVTNEHLAAIIRGWDAPVLVAGDPPIAVPPMGPRQPPARFSVVCVCTYGDDEPIGEVLAAARRLPDVRFALTGNTKYARPEWLADPPPNVEFTGFVPLDEY